MASRRIEDLHAVLYNVYEVVSKDYAKRYPEAPQPFLCCTYRSSAEQNVKYAVGRTRPGRKVTNAKGGESPHNYLPAFAFDICFIWSDKTLEWAPKWFRLFWDLVLEHFGGFLVRWGGNFTLLRDLPHFELSDWKQRVK